MTKQQIIQRLDEIECELFSQYRKVERLRLELQREWRVLPVNAKSDGLAPARGSAPS